MRHLGLRLRLGLLLGLLISLLTPVAYAEDRQRAQKELEAGAKSYNAGEYEEALSHYLEAIKAAPSAAGPYRELGKTYDALGDYKKAKEAYEEFLKRAPEHAQAPAIKARVDEISASSEDRTKAQLALEAGAAAYNQGDYREARRQYQLAIQAAPSAAGPYRELGKTYDALNEYQNAKEAYEEYLKRRPDAKDADQIKARLAELGTIVKEPPKPPAAATQDPFVFAPSEKPTPKTSKKVGVAILGAVVLGGVAAGALIANNAGNNLILGGN